MARPTKQGIDYFPLDTEFDDDLQLLIAEIGAEGLGILITIWQAVYKSHGYYINHDAKLPLKIKQKCFSNVENIIDVVGKAIDFGIFDVDMYKNYRILTSRGIQKRFFVAARAKKQIEIVPEYILIDVSCVDNTKDVVINGVLNSRNATKEEEEEEVKEEVKVKEEMSVGSPSKNNIPYKEIIEYLNQKADKCFNPTGKETQRFIKARWNQGFRLDAFKFVIDIKCSKWLTDPKMVDYIRPQTLFGTKFESYLNEKTKHPLSDIVSDKTIKSIEALNEWERKEIEDEQQV